MQIWCPRVSAVSGVPHRIRVAERRRVLRGGGCAAGGALLADLVGLGQPQAYSVHKGREPDSGETVFHCVNTARRPGAHPAL
jgi:hypothetical protein